MAALLSTPYLTISTDPDSSLVRYIRSAAPYESLAIMDRENEKAGQLFDQLGRRRHLLLVDMREAALNNDPEFEVRAARARQILVRDFPRVAVLVKTAVGALQVARHIREDAMDMPVYQDEATAISFLLGASGFDVERLPPSSRQLPPSSKTRSLGVRRRSIR